MRFGYPGPPPLHRASGRPARQYLCAMAPPADAEAKAVRAVVRGEVQGVGFREMTRRRAGKLGAMGWVRNGEDGSVLVHAEGPGDAVEELVAFLEQGPPSAREMRPT